MEFAHFEFENLDSARSDTYKEFKEKDKAIQFSLSVLAIATSGVGKFVLALRNTHNTSVFVFCLSVASRFL